MNVFWLEEEKNTFSVPKSSLENFRTYPLRSKSYVDERCVTKIINHLYYTC